MFIKFKTSNNELGVTCLLLPNLSLASYTHFFLHTTDRLGLVLPISHSFRIVTARENKEKCPASVHTELFLWFLQPETLKLRKLYEREILWHTRQSWTDRAMDTWVASVFHPLGRDITPQTWSQKVLQLQEPVLDETTLHLYWLFLYHLCPSWPLLQPALLTGSQLG